MMPLCVTPPSCRARTVVPDQTIKRTIKRAERMLQFLQLISTRSSSSVRLLLAPTSSPFAPFALPARALSLGATSGGTPPAVVRAGATHPVLPRDRLTFSFSRSSGAGGQNVNKVNTKAEVRFVLADAAWMDADVRERFAEQCGACVNAEGEVFVTSQKHRTQEANLEDALVKLTHMVRKAAAVPKVRQLRTGLSELTKDKNRDDKRHRSGVKSFRRGPSLED